MPARTVLTEEQKIYAVITVQEKPISIVNFVILVMIIAQISY